MIEWRDIAEIVTEFQNSTQNHRQLPLQKATVKQLYTNNTFFQTKSL